MPCKTISQIIIMNKTMKQLMKIQEKDQFTKIIIKIHYKIISTLKGLENKKMRIK